MHILQASAFELMEGCASDQTMFKQCSMNEAISRLVPDRATVAIGLQLEQMIPFAAAQEIMRQKKRGLTLIGPVSDILFDQFIAAGCVERVIAAWVGNAMMGSAYNFRRATELNQVHIVEITNLALALALEAGAMGLPFLPTRTALGSEVAQDNEFFRKIFSPYDEQEVLWAVRALNPDVAIVHVQRADYHGNAHCWGNLGVMVEAIRAARSVIVTAEEIVEPSVITSDPNRTVVPGFLVDAVVQCRGGAHPSPVQGYYNRDDAFFVQYHRNTRTLTESLEWLANWIYAVPDRGGYLRLLGASRLEELRIKKHAYAAMTDFGY